MYIELHAASAFSFLEAASLPERLAERAEELGDPAIALLDRDGLYGASRLPVLVETQQGYRNLCRLITTMKLRAPKGEGALTLEDFEGFTGGLVALAGRPLLMDRAQAPRLLDRLVGLFGQTRTGGARGQ